MKTLLTLTVAAVCVALLLTFSFDAEAAAGAASALPVLHALALDPSGLLIGFGGLTIQAMREKRGVLAKDVRDLMDKHPADKPGAWGDEQQKVYDEKVGEIERLDAAISREQKLLDLSAEKAFKEAGGRELEPPKKTASAALFDKWMRGGDKALSAEEWGQIVRNTMSTTTGSEGGYTVESEIAATVIEAMKQFGGMRRVADVFSTAKGNPLSYPTSDGTAEEGELLAENAPATDADPNFGTKSLNTFKFSSKVITVPIELLQDSVVDVEAMVRNRIAQRIGRITNKKFTIGTGTAEPNGVVTASTVGKTGTTGQTTTVIFDDLVDLIHSVDPAYRELGRCRFMMHDSSLKVVRKLKDNQGRPIFIPGWDGLGRSMPDEILGYPVQINQDVAVMAANAKSILFGDFFFYKIRDALEITFHRFTDSAYAKKGQVGFLAWHRAGGNYVDVGGGVKHYANSAT